ncbi:ABC transporter permease [Acetivibrio cellulolyticus]|uniref:ABC transporter permease n=1 Tax=Acetivibrio cellulolyticus TaxID=35830 RepID=UPI0001E2E2E5|nr:ABC transporter permease [Acetivibrio cellulolyticus]
MSLGFRIATRFLKSNLGQTILIILGIAIGVSVQIFIGSLIQGLQKGLVEKTIGSSSQITITSDQKDVRITEYGDLLEQLYSMDNRIRSISVAQDNPAFLVVGDNSQSLLVRGFEIDKADKIYKLYDRIVEGTYPKNENEIILGVDLKDEYSIKAGDEVVITTTNQKSVSCKVVGFFDLKVTSLNTGWGITTLKTSQDLFETGDSISSIEMQLQDDAVFAADEIASEINGGIPKDKYKVVNWKEQNESLLSGLQGQSISSYMIQVFVMISVLLGIASILAITVIQKSRQIGILKAMGIRNSLASTIFLFEGLILGFFGAILGIVLGLGLSFAFTKFALNPDGTPVIDLYISYSFIGLSGLIAMLASVIAALFPALRSSRLNPIEIIRNN